MGLTIKRALVVDDTPSNLQMMEIMLKRHGLVVEHAINGTDALDLMQETAPDLILLDIRMPGMSGYEFCEAVRQNPAWQKVEIIIVTAVDKADILPDRLQSLNIRDVIRKPVMNDDLEMRLFKHFS